MSLEQSLSHENLLPRYIKLLTFSIASPSIFTLASFSSGFFSKVSLSLLHLYAFHIVHFLYVICRLSYNFSLLCSIISMSSATLVQSITMNTFLLFSVFLILSIILSRNKANDHSDNGSLVYYQLSSHTIHSDVH